MNKFNSSWIAKGITKDTVEFTEEFGKFLKNEGLTTSQIRNVFGELKRIQMSGFEKEKVAFLLLKPKLAYATSRLRRGGQEQFRQVFDQACDAIDVDGDKASEQFDNLVYLMESIIAYHKSVGGR